MATGIVNILRFFFSTAASRIIRFLSWNYRMLSLQTGSGVKIDYPARIEGSGQLIIGDGSVISNKVSFGVSKGSSIQLKKDVNIQTNVNIHAGEKALIQLEDNTRILSNTVLRNGNRATLKTGSSIASGCQVFPREPGFDGEFYLGRGSNVGDFTIIDTCDDVIIKDFVAVGPGGIFYTHDHDYKRSSLAAWKGAVKKGKIILEKGSWIGARVTILPNVTIGERAIVAAGSVVTKNVQAGDVVGGIPARSLKKINHENQH